MADSITKKDLDQYQKAIVDALDFKLDKSEKGIGFKLNVLETHIDKRFNALENRIAKLEENVNKLTIALDNFLKIMTDYKEEFAILKAEVDQIKNILKEKLGVEVAVQK